MFIHSPGGNEWTRGHAISLHVNEISLGAIVARGKLISRRRLEFEMNWPTAYLEIEVPCQLEGNMSHGVERPWMNERVNVV